MHAESKSVARSIARRAYPTAALVLATLVVAWIYLDAMLAGTGGHLGAPLDDAYIYFNYARHMAAGSLYEFNPGDGVSTGATSVLWTPLLAVGYLVGFRDESIVAWAFLLNTLCLFGYGLLLLRLGEVLLRSRALATLLATALVLEGRVLWGFFSGMELGLYLLSQVAACYAFVAYQRDGRRRTGWWLCASLSVLVLARPEGQTLGLLLLVVFVAWRLLAGRRPGEATPLGRRVRPVEWIWVLVPLALIALTYGAFYLATGEVSQNGMRTKSHLYAPDGDPWVILRASFKFYRDMIFRHFPWLLETSLRHVMDLFFFFGFLYGIGRETRRRRPGLFCLLGLWFFVGLGVQSLVLPVAYHHGRYQMNYTFIFWLVLVWGAQAVLSRLRLKRRQLQFVMAGSLTLLALLMINTVVAYRSVFRSDCKTIHGQHVAMGRYIDAHLPSDATVGLNDAGAISYFGQRYVYDLFGLTTNEAARWKWLGEACIFEQLFHLERDGRPRRPDYLAIYDKWYPRIIATGLLEELVGFEAPKKSIAGGPRKSLYRIRWDQLGDKTRSQVVEQQLASRGLRVVDRVDVAFRPDEMAHGYAHFATGRASEKGSALLAYGPYAGKFDPKSFADGGREIVESEAFTVDGLSPDKPLVVIRRTTGAEAGSQVSVDGHVVGDWEPSRGPKRTLRETWFEVPAHLVDSPRLRLSFVLAAPSSKQAVDEKSGRDKRARRKASPPRGYRTYYYWLAQPG